jgi:hypothetical protein
LGQFFREICPFKKYSPKYKAASGIIAGELLNSLLEKETHDWIFSKKNMYKIPRDNGSSLNKLITIKIIALMQ